MILDNSLNKNIVYSEKIPALDERPVKPCTILLPEIFEEISQHLDIKSIGRLSLVSREWYVINTNENVWKRYEKESLVQAPDIKWKMGRLLTSLDGLNHWIKTLMDTEKNKEFFCNVVKILFEGNVKHICGGVLMSDEKKYYIKLDKRREISFDRFSLYNFSIPQEVEFILSKNTITFLVSRIIVDNRAILEKITAPSDIKLNDSFKFSTINLHEEPLNFTLYSNEVERFFNSASFIDKPRIEFRFL